jgi:hypothetical protein|tara:strand:+ start:1924 stop:2154 length:231 start_codon:yes stop_codon:yes gene_type:complete
MKSKSPFDNGKKEPRDPKSLPLPPTAPAADKPSWVDLITKKDVKAVKKAMDNEKLMNDLHDKLMGATGLHSKPNKK